MKIQLVSDLHLENNPDFVLRPAPGAEVLVLAGDIGSYQRGSLLAANDFGLSRFSRAQLEHTFKSIVFVPGNHEYDLLDFDETHVRLREVCEELGIVWLERQSVILDNTRFVGTTLWSDFDAESRAIELNSGLKTPDSQIDATKKREKAFRAANFYLRRNTTIKDGRPMLAEDMRSLALECQTWLRESLATPYDGKTVVVTHFAPSLRSADPRYGVTPGTAGFCNSLDDLFANADFWLHGHLHCQNDYVVQGTQGSHEYKCRVISNPLGYFDKGEQEGFRAQFLIDV